MKTFPGTLALALALVVLLAGCAHRGNDALYQQLGELEGITRIVDSFIDEISNDPVIVEHFAETDPERFREKLIEQFCSLSGGPCEYTGDSMKKSHAGHNFTETDFNALVEDLVAAMEKQDVPTTAQNRLLALLAPMRADTTYQ